MCRDRADRYPPTSKTIKSDAIHLLDLVSERHAAARFGLDQSRLDIVRRHTHRFLVAVLESGYDYWQRIPVLIDWNLGNFSVEFDESDDVDRVGRFSLFSRWDYDWFRIESRLLDFYFLSRVSSRTGDKTRFTYGAHTLLEPRFRRFLRTYHRSFPLSDDEVLFLKETYRFFLLNYVVREGEHFFRYDIWQHLLHDVVDVHLPALDDLDLTPLLAELAEGSAEAGDVAAVAERAQHPHAERGAGDEEHERADEAGGDVAGVERLAGEHVAQRRERVRAGQHGERSVAVRRAVPRPG